jgi:hypothetical protein
VSPVSYEDITIASLRPVSSPGFSRPRFGSITETPEGEHLPVLESMSQGAIEEMVDRTFESAGVVEGGGLDFEGFKRVVEGDSNMLAWFEALGSVF